MRLLAAILLSFPLFAQEASTQKAPESAPATAQAPAAEPRLSVELGNRWTTDIGGSYDAYRSVVNLAEGPRVFGADLSLGASPLFDKLSVRSTGWGGEPNSAARLDAERQRTYRLSVDYRNSAYFNALPSFADLGTGRGVFLNQRSFDIRRKMIDARLDLLPTRRLIPFLAYSRNWGYGTGLTDFVVDANEYVVPNNLQDQTDDYRGGVRLEFNRFHATLEQGGTAFKDDQRLYQATGTNPGDRTSTFLGQRLSLATLNQAYRVRGTSMYSRALFTANPFSWIELSGQYLYSRPRSTADVYQNNTGNFVSLDPLTFFTSQTAQLSSEARMPHTSGSFGAQLRLHSRLRVFESFVTDRFHTVSSLLGVVSATTPATQSAPGATFLEPIEYTYNRQEFNVLFDLTSRLTLRGGHRYVWGDAQARAPDLSQTGPKETGELKMQTGLAGLTYRPASKLSLFFDFEAASADRNYFRTSLQDYHRLQIRAKYQALSSLSLSANFSQLDNENPAPASLYKFENRNNSLSAYWTPWGGKWFSLLADYTRSTLSSDLSYIVPQTLRSARSYYVERAHVGTAALDFNLPRFQQQSPKLTVGGSLFVSSGSRPTQFYQPLGRFSFPLHRRASLFADWRWYNLGEQFYAYEGFRTHQFTLGLRLGL
jgi:hypothetical protein